MVGLGPGLGLKYEIVLQAGPGHNCCGPGLGLIIQFAGRARAGSAQLLRGRARASNKICGPGLGLDFRPVHGPNSCDTLLNKMFTGFTSFFISCVIHVTHY